MANSSQFALPAPFFILVAIACGFASVCYAELAAMIPIAGSAYTYTYATMGEIIAWIIGWDLILEYAVSNMAVSVGFSAHLVDLLLHRLLAVARGQLDALQVVDDVVDLLVGQRPAAQRELLEHGSVGVGHAAQAAHGDRGNSKAAGA